MLSVFDHIPAGLLEAPAPDLHRILPGPSLVHLPGRREQPLFASIMLHGNEDTGLRAVQALLRRYQQLPRALSIFIGNVSAARYGARFLPGQPDYNRIWPGTDAPDSAEAAMVREVVEIMAARGVFASIDIHNNTGTNPLYGCVNRLDHRFLHLASLFSRTVVYFVRPLGVQSMAFAELCPAATLECGKAGQAHGLQHAVDYLDACLNLSEIPTQPVPEHDIDVFHTVAVVKVPTGVSFSFSYPEAEILFNGDLDHLNFCELPAGTSLGAMPPNEPVRLIAISEQGDDVTDLYFENAGGRLVLKKSAMPSMLTLDEQIIRQDCLCYLMERCAWIR
ncbi:MAG: M14 family metallopeptidase [Nitrococcus sp.]|nr:M14 family metallopeptidase [Nitrococcus sp.]